MVACRCLLDVYFIVYCCLLHVYLSYLLLALCIFIAYYCLLYVDFSYLLFAYVSWLRIIVRYYTKRSMWKLPIAISTTLITVFFWTWSCAIIFTCTVIYFLWFAVSSLYFQFCCASCWVDLREKLCCPAAVPLLGQLPYYWSSSVPFPHGHCVGGVLPPRVSAYCASSTTILVFLGIQ